MQLNLPTSNDQHQVLALVVLLIMANEADLTHPALLVVTSLQVKIRPTKAAKDSLSKDAAVVEAEACAVLDEVHSIVDVEAKSLVSPDQKVTMRHLRLLPQLRHLHLHLRLRLLLLPLPLHQKHRNRAFKIKTSRLRFPQKISLYSRAS